VDRPHQYLWGIHDIGGLFVEYKGFRVMSTTITRSYKMTDRQAVFSISSSASFPNRNPNYTENAKQYHDDHLDDSQSVTVTAGTKPSSHAQAQEQPYINGTPVKVLLVEDNMDLAEIIVESLRLTDMGIDVQHVTHGTKALEKFKTLNPTLILLDLHLPDMSGWRILDSINELQATIPKEQHAKIIVITSFDDPPNRLISKLQGITYYLTKPITMDELEAVVRQALDNDE
jgi:CheY-like chemotaxis protein